MRRINIHKDQLILPFGQGRERVISMSAHAGYDYRVKVFWALVTVSLMSLVAYIYAINITARNIAERQTLERQMTERSRTLDSLEFAYIEMRNNVTMETAYERGFKEEKSPLFVSRIKSSSLTVNDTNR